MSVRPRPSIMSELTDKERSQHASFIDVGDALYSKSVELTKLARHGCFGRPSARNLLKIAEMLDSVGKSWRDADRYHLSELMKNEDSNTSIQFASRPGKIIVDASKDSFNLASLESVTDGDVYTSFQAICGLQALELGGTPQTIVDVNGKVSLVSDLSEGNAEFFESNGDLNFKVRFKLANTTDKVTFHCGTTWATFPDSNGRTNASNDQSSWTIDGDVVTVTINRTKFLAEDNWEEVGRPRLRFS